mgnify:CR=1 FL=1
MIRRNYKKISELNPITSASLNTYVAGVDNGETVKVTLGVLADGVRNTINTLDDQRLSSLEHFTASYTASVSFDSSSFATTGSNTFNGTQTISGSVYVTGNLTVIGSSSIANISSSVVSVGTNTIVLNTYTPAVRFGGISVIDSGSSAQTGSLFWDSLNNRWVYQQASGSSYGGGMLLSNSNLKSLENLTNVGVKIKGL